MRSHTFLLAVAGFCVFLAGCGLAPSVNPLSEEEDTVLDERLIGRWHGLKGAEGEEVETSPEQLYVGRWEGSPNELDAVWLELTDERVKVRRLRVRTTKIGEHRFLSATAPEMLSEEETPRQAWLLARYRMVDANHVHLWSLSPEVAVKAIEAGTLAGTLEPKAGAEDGESEYEWILVTADTAALRTWVEAHALEAFPEKNPGRLRRADAQAQAPDEVDTPEEHE